MWIIPLYSFAVRQSIPVAPKADVRVACGFVMNSVIAFDRHKQYFNNPVY